MMCLVAIGYKHSNQWFHTLYKHWQTIMSQRIAYKAARAFTRTLNQCLCSRNSRQKVGQSFSEQCLISDTSAGELALLI